MVARAVSSQRANSGAVPKSDLSCSVQTVSKFNAASKCLLDPDNESPDDMVDDVCAASGAEE
jgi:hypothetical protein